MQPTAVITEDEANMAVTLSISVQEQRKVYEGNSMKIETTQSDYSYGRLINHSRPMRFKPLLCGWGMEDRVLCLERYIECGEEQVVPSCHYYIKLLVKSPFQEYAAMSLMTLTKRLMKSMLADLDTPTVERYRRIVALLVSY